MTEPRKTPRSKVSGLAAMLERFAETYHACASNEADRWGAGRLLEAAKQLRALEIETQELVAALREIASYGKDGICPYGCDGPDIAQQAVARHRAKQPPTP